MKYSLTFRKGGKSKTGSRSLPEDSAVAAPISESGSRSSGEDGALETSVSEGAVPPSRRAPSVAPQGDTGSVAALQRNTETSAALLLAPLVGANRRGSKGQRATHRRREVETGGEADEASNVDDDDDVDDDEDEDEDLHVVRRRFSISTPSEWVAPLCGTASRPKAAMQRGVSFSYDDPNFDPLGAAGPGRQPRGLVESHSSSRVERLLRARARRSSGQLADSEHQQQQQRGGDSPATDQGPTRLKPGLRAGSSLGLDADGCSPAGLNRTASVVVGPTTASSSLSSGSSRNPSYESLASPRAPAAAPGTPQRLLIVANRLPVRAARTKEGSWTLELSSGGLVSALLGVKQNYETCWIGWPGLYLKGSQEQALLRDSLIAKGCVPVFLSENIVDGYYNGYCNNVLWPLLHYIGLPQEDRLTAIRSMESQYEAYREANQLFADVVMERYREGDVVWVHDYHLMLLPSYLKAKVPGMKVGWFLHTPFPSSEVFRTLPLRGEILQAAIASDLIGFHTYDYARHFVSACSRILGHEGTFDGVEDHGRLTRVAAFPIGIDPERFIAALDTPVVKTHIAELRSRFSGRKVMLGVDRLDMIKGIPQKLVAYEKFLEENPGWRDRVLLVQIAVPSRTDVPEYQRLTSQVHEIVGRINGKFGTLTTVPIHHLDRSLAFHELCALYAITDVALVTSLRDGMNLVSYEYVACQNQNKGVLVLSEFAGAAQSLGAGAILVNPWNVSDVCSAIEDALTMSEEDRIERHRYNFMHVTTHTAQAWADTFVSELNDTVVEAQLRTQRVPPLLPVTTTTHKYHTSTNRLLILGFNSTLTANSEAARRRGPDQIKEMKLRLHPAMVPALRRLCGDPATTVIVISGSERAVLDEAFSEFPLWLAAENGLFMRHTRGEWLTTMPEHLNMDWFESVQLVFEYFCERTPRSYVEMRETSLVWNYKYSDAEFGRAQARDMLQHLWTGPISNAAVDVIQGGKSVEVRPVGISKGAAMERILAEVAHQRPLAAPFDFVLVVGHFLHKDEDIFTFFEPDSGTEGGAPMGASRSVDRGTERTARSERSSSMATCGRFIGPDPALAGGAGVAGGGRWLPKRGLPLKPFSSLQAVPLGSSPSDASLTLQAARPSSRGEDSGRGGGGCDPRGPEEVSRGAAPDGEAPWQGGSGRSSGEYSAVVDVHEDHYYSCSVGRKRSSARYSLPTSDDVVRLLEGFARDYPHRPIFQTG